MEEPCQNSGVPQSLAPVLYYRRTDILLWMWLILSSNSVPEGVYFDLMGAASGQQTVESQDWSDVRVRTLNKNEGIPHPRTEDPHKSPPPPHQCCWPWDAQDRVVRWKNPPQSPWSVPHVQREKTQALTGVIIRTLTVR